HAAPLADAPRSENKNRGGVKLQVADFWRAQKISVPTRTCVAPSAMAVVKSALMRLDSSSRPLRLAILAVSAKCGHGASSSGGMHIRPEIFSPYWSRHAAR